LAARIRRANARDARRWPLLAVHGGGAGELAQRQALFPRQAWPMMLSSCAYCARHPSSRRARAQSATSRAVSTGPARLHDISIRPRAHPIWPLYHFLDRKAVPCKVVGALSPPSIAFQGKQVGAAQIAHVI